MGNQKPTKLPPKPTLEDALLQMKMGSKRMARQSSKAMKQSEQYMKKAQLALRKNNEEGAKLYLQSAASRRAQSMNIQRMGLKMEFICGNMKNMNNNEQIMNSFQQLGQIAGQTTGPDFAKIAGSMNKMQTVMDNMLINGKMMQEMMNQNQPIDNTADDMLDALKGKIALETQNKIDQAALIGEKQKQYNDTLKKL